MPPLGVVNVARYVFQAPVSVAVAIRLAVRTRLTQLSIAEFAALSQAASAAAVSLPVTRLPSDSAFSTVMLSRPVPTILIRACPTCGFGHQGVFLI